MAMTIETIDKAVTAVVVAWLLLGLPHCTAAKAHQAPAGWDYPFDCCSNTDCRQVPASAVNETPEGYTVPSGELLKRNDRRLKPSPDGLYHWCSVSGVDDGRTLCLFVPPAAM